MWKFLTSKYLFKALVGLLLLACNVTSLANYELGVFQFTDFEGNLSLQYQKDEQFSGSADGPKSQYALTSTEQELNLMSHSYVYHPNMLNIDFGVGLHYTQNEREMPDNNTKYDEDKYSLVARLNFLREKPYPFTLYYEIDQPSTTSSQTERFIQTTEKYGANATIKKPVLPFLVNIETFRQTQNGQGATQVINTSTEQVNLRTQHNLGKRGFAQLNFLNRQYTSQSGLIGEPSTKRETNSESVSLNSQLNLGQRQQFKFNNLISYITQDNLPERKELRWMPYLSWDHTPDTASYYRFDYQDSEIDHVESRGRAGSISINSQLSDTVLSNGNITSETRETTGLKRDREGLSGRLSYTTPLSFGHFSVSGGGQYNETTQETTLTIIDKKSESIRLEGTQQVDLAVPNVLSVSQVIHENPDRQHIILIEGVDYEIDLAGGVGVAYIRRLGTINLESGESVLVDYQYQSGGSIVYASFNQSYSARLDFLRYYSIYYSYSDTAMELKDGVSTVPLNPVRRNQMGFRVEVPFLAETLRVGGEVRRTEQDEQVAPYVRKEYETFMQMQLFSDTSLRLATHRVIQDNEYSATGIDRRRQTARLTLHPLPRSSLLISLMNEKDTGSSIVRRSQQWSVVGQWRIRDLILSVDGLSTNESQGSYEREHNVFMLRLNRVF